MKSVATSILMVVWFFASMQKTKALTEEKVSEFLSELESLKASLEESMAQRNAQSKQLRTEQNSIRQKLEAQASHVRRLQDEKTPAWAQSFKDDILSAIEAATTELDTKIDEVSSAVEGQDKGGLKAAARMHLNAAVRSRLSDEWEDDFAPRYRDADPFAASSAVAAPPGANKQMDHLEDQLEKEAQKRRKLKQRVSQLETDFFDLKIDIAELKVEVNVTKQKLVESHGSASSASMPKMRCETGVKSSGELESNNVTSQHVNFTRPFLNTPHVLVAASMAAKYKEKDGVQKPAGPIDFHLRKRHVTPKSFNIEFKSSHGEDGFVFATWMACGQAF